MFSLAVQKEKKNKKLHKKRTAVSAVAHTPGRRRRRWQPLLSVLSHLHDGAQFFLGPVVPHYPLIFHPLSQRIPPSILESLLRARVGVFPSHALEYDAGPALQQPEAHEHEARNLGRYPDVQRGLDERPLMLSIDDNDDDEDHRRGTVKTVTLAQALTMVIRTATAMGRLGATIPSY